MRIKTIKKRMRLTALSIEAIELLYTMMRGISDKSTEAGQKNNEVWAIAAVFIFTKFTASKQGKVMFMTELATQKQKRV